MKIDEMSNNNIIIVDKYSECFPQMLREIKDCPERLFCVGDLELLGTRSISIVGSRKTTPYGRTISREISSKIARRGITVVSGMAGGIDSCAHAGALDVEGKTIAVLGCGVDVCYPKNNWELRNQIAREGLIISEFEPGTKPEWYNFPQRNRIISGLSESTIVVQAGVRSGSMITAELAMEQGRNVFAVPGNIDSQYNLGSNKLIKEGITPILTVGDLFDTINIDPIDEEEAQVLLSDSEKIVYDVLVERGEMTVDGLCFVTGMAPHIVSKLLTVLELKGIVFDELGKFFVAKK
ncbi:MAG: DNA-processing protein DprA [Eubacterium sp.]|nr:DNA-processing protein DprA [Candidatus Colimonas fimequi]